MVKDPRLAITDGIQALSPSADFYGVLVSQHIFNMLELRSAVMADQEVPVMNKLPIAVDRKFTSASQWVTVATREEWLKRASAK